MNWIMLLLRVEGSNVDKFLILSSFGEAESMKVEIGGKSLDPNYKGSGVVLSNNDKTAFLPPGNANTAVGILPISKGKKYWEVVIDFGTNALIGVTRDGENLSSNTYTSGGSRYYGNSGHIYRTSATSYGESFTTGDIIGVALDMDNGTIEFYKNGVSQGVAFSDVLTLESVRPSVTRTSSTGSTTFSFRFESRDLFYPVPNGYSPYGDNIIVSISSQNEEELVVNGMNDLSTVDFKTKYKQKQYIQDQYQELGDGRIFSHTVNFDKYIINKIEIQ